MTMITKYKRTLIAIGIILVAYFNFNFSMNYKINQELNKAKRDGQITELSQLMNYIRSDNRSKIYLGAAEMVDFKANLRGKETLEEYYRRNKDGLSEIFSKNQMVFDLMDASLTKGQCSFNLDYEKGFEMIIPNYLRIRSTAQLLALKAFDDIENKNYDDAVKRCNECLLLGKDLGNEKGSLIGQMIAIAVVKIGLEPLNYMVNNNIEANYVPVYNQLNEIKNSLPGNFITSIEAERTAGVDLYNKIINNHKSAISCYDSPVPEMCINNRYIAKIIKPYILADELNYVKHMNKLVEDLKKNPGQQIVCPEISKYCIFSNILIPNISRAQEKELEIIANCNELANKINNI